MKCMGHFIHNAFLWIIHAITDLFLIGMIGCFAVLVLTFIEDLQTIFHSE
jgi:hypothetical protein